MNLDFSELNFVDTCEIVTNSTSTVTYCYSSATALNEILIITGIFFLIVYGFIKFMNKI